MTEIHDVGQLEQAVGARSATGHLKSIGFLDAHATALLARSPLTVVGTLGADGAARIRTVGGPLGICTAAGTRTLTLPGLATDGLVDGAPVGALSLVPGYGETLRVNGTLRLDVTPRIEIGEVFLHCAKAIIRSQLWQPASTTEKATAVAAGSEGVADPAVRQFLADARFATLFSLDDRDGADVSPKGDPAGFVHVLDERTVAVPDRPGNRRTDTLHNLLARPELALLAFVAGDPRTLELRGRAHVSDDPTLLAPMAVNAKVPRAAVVLRVQHATLALDPGVGAASLWSTEQHVAPGELPRASRIWTDHVKLNEDKGLAAAAARKLANERMLAKGLDRDYATNLY
jgi:uncharacterized protein